MSATEEEGGGAPDLADILPAEEVAWPAATFDVELRKPVEFKGDTFEALTLREPTGEEWEDICEHPVKTRRRYAISRIAGVPMQVVAKVGIGDLVRGENYLNSFFDVGQAIGGW